MEARMEARTVMRRGWADNAGEMQTGLMKAYFCQAGAATIA